MRPPQAQIAAVRNDPAQHAANHGNQQALEQNDRGDGVAAGPQSSHHGDITPAIVHRVIDCHQDSDGSHDAGHQRDHQQRGQQRPDDRVHQLGNLADRRGGLNLDFVLL